MNAQAVEGEVVILGPDGVAVSMTAAAAEESARRLIEAARQARQVDPEADPDGAD